MQKDFEEFLDLELKWRLFLLYSSLPDGFYGLNSKQQRKFKQLCQVLICYTDEFIDQHHIEIIKAVDYAKVSCKGGTDPQDYTPEMLAKQEETDMRLLQARLKILNKVIPDLKKNSCNTPIEVAKCRCQIAERDKITA